MRLNLLLPQIDLMVLFALGIALYLATWFLIRKAYARIGKGVSNKGLSVVEGMTWVSFGTTAMCWPMGLYLMLSNPYLPAQQKTTVIILGLLPIVAAIALLALGTAMLIHAQHHPRVEYSENAEVRANVFEERSVLQLVLVVAMVLLVGFMRDLSTQRFSVSPPETKGRGPESTERERQMERPTKERASGEGETPIPMTPLQ